MLVLETFFGVPPVFIPLANLGASLKKTRRMNPRPLRKPNDEALRSPRLSQHETRLTGIGLQLVTTSGLEAW